MGKRERKRKSGVGAFFGGTFFGFLLGIGAIVGIVAFAYFKVSPQWINNTFKTSIDLGSDEINNKTLSDVVTTVMSIANNSDSYTLNNLKDDFGVELGNELMGINVEDLKAVPLADLADAVQNKFSNISTEELKNLFSSESLDDIMAKTKTYYYKQADGKLYEELNGSTYSKPATFDYTIDNRTVKIKTFDPISFNTGEDTVDITLKYLPITEAIDAFAGNLGENITLQELKGDYGVDLPCFIYNGNETKTINQLQEIIDGLTVTKILDLNVRYDNSTKKYYNDKNNNGVKDAGEDAGEEEVSSIVNAIKDTTINGLSTKINELTVAEIFPNRTGALALISSTATINEIPEEIQNIIEQNSIEELIDAGVIDVSELSASEQSKLEYPTGGTLADGITPEQIKHLSLQGFIEFCLKNLPTV